MAEYDSCSKQREERPLKKLTDRLHIPPYLFLSRESGDDVGDVGKHDFRSVLLHPSLSNANRMRQPWTAVSALLGLISIT